jgi:hypothetical protein
VWVAIVIKPGYNGHCVVMKGGQAFDNGWASLTGVHSLTVCGAWELHPPV